MSHHTNIVRIKAVANLLNLIKEEFVFVGGAKFLYMVIKQEGRQDQLKMLM